jgi:hypothetical protein
VKATTTVSTDPSFTCDFSSSSFTRAILTFGRLDSARDERT